MTLDSSHRKIVTAIFVAFSVYVYSQNLVPNPSFETYTVCPTNVNNGEPFQGPPWYIPTDGSTDYLNACANPGNAGVPNNLFGNQNAHTGVAYAGIGMWFVSFVYREYLTVPLTETLMADTAYEVSFYVSRAENSCGEDKIGAYFSQTPPPNVGIGVLPFDPQVSSNLGIISNNTDWTLITGCFVAEGGEQYMTLGNFFNNNEMTLDPACSPAIQSYYYVDDVSVIKFGEPDEFNVDLGDPVVACGQYVIDPGYSGNDAHYQWEDGSIDPTLTVSESGTYAVTIFDGCAFGIDSLEVTIIPGETVDIGPPMVVFCEGDTYTVSLDPSLGDYTWQDGSHDTEYDITMTGTYSVTLDDGCFPTSDEVEVTVFTPPAPFFLGPDTALCQGDMIQYNFDPALGDFTWQNGWQTPNYTISHSGTYALTISSVCGQFTDEIEVDFIQGLDINLGPDVTLCEGEEYLVELDPSLGDFLWQDGSDENYFQVTMPGLYSVTVTNPCESASSSINVLGSTEPVFDLGNDVTICSAQLPYQLNLNNLNSVDFVWQDGSMNSDFQVTGSGLYSVTVSNTCYSVPDEINITVIQPVNNVILPADFSICDGEPFVLTNEGDDGAYTWQDNSTADTFLVTSPGTYSVTVSNTCGSASDDVNIDLALPPSFPDLGGNISLCPGDHIILYPPNSGGSFLWQDMSTADSLVVTTAGTYYVQVSNSCATLSDTVVITINSNPPVLALPSSVSLCQGDTLNIDAGINGVTYMWNDQSQASSLHISSPGIYSLTVSNSCGSDIDTVMVADAGTIPTIDLGPDISICMGDTILLQPIFSNANTWLWQDSSIDSFYQITTSGMINVEVDNICGVATDTLFVQPLPAIPSFSLGPDSLVCPGTSIALEINIPDVTIQWPDGSSGAQYIITAPGIYPATISNSCGTNEDTFQLFNLPPAPDLNLGIDQSLCAGEVITLDPNLPGVDYLWQDGSTDSIYVSTEPGTIILIVSNQCGFDTDSVNIILTTAGPQVNLGPDVLACEGDQVQIISDISGVDYLWQDGSTLSSITTDTSGVFILQVSNNCGMDADTVAVEIEGSSPNTNLGADTTLCEGEILLLSSMAPSGTSILWQDGSSQATFLVNSPGIYSVQEVNHCGMNQDTIAIQYLNPPTPFDIGGDTSLCNGESVLLQVPATMNAIQWQDGSTSSSYTVNTSGTYAVTVSNTCGVESDQLDVLYVQPPIPFDIGEDTTICLGESIVLIAPVSNDEIEWQDGSHDVTFIADQQQVYSLEISNVCGAVFDQFFLSVNDQVPQAYLPVTTYLCAGDEVELNVTQLFPASYLWNSGSQESSIIVSQPGIYNVSIQAACGQKNLSTQVVKADTCDIAFYVPNIFSPNGDGINDVFLLGTRENLEIQSLDITIFDRWGNMAYSSNDKAFSWDGRFKNELLMPGVYAYVLNLEFITNNKLHHQTISGDITLIR